MTLAFRVLSLCLAMLAAGCARGDSGAAAWLAEALAAHRQADLLLQRGEKEEARGLLQAAADRDVPRATDPRDARVVRQDLLYRVAEIELSSGHPDAALRTATRGIELGRGTDVFTTNLLIVRGRAEEAAHDLTAASRDYHDALVITDSLLDARLEGVKRPR